MVFLNGARESDSSVRGVHVEIKTLSGRQLVSTLLAAAAHLHLPLPPLLLVALYGRLPSFVGKKFFLMPPLRGHSHSG